jgi:hypothetical protein
MKNSSTLFLFLLCFIPNEQQDSSCQITSISSLPLLFFRKTVGLSILHRMERPLRCLHWFDSNVATLYDFNHQTYLLQISKIVY